LIGVFLSITYVFAASARGSLLALFFVYLCMYVNYHGLNVKIMISALSILLVGVISAVIFDYSGFLDWAGNILEINSDTRGVDSGGTGRFDLWAMGVDFLLSNFDRFMFGGGFRSAEESSIGFLTENSYLTIYLELGVFVGTLLISTYFYYCFMIVRGSCSIRDDGVMCFGSCFIVGFAVLFLIVQSVFNRYLFAIGNPYSVSVLLLMFSASIYFRPVVRHG
jgi:exopolysaccharide production protein ExoQ